MTAGSRLTQSDCLRQKSDRFSDRSRPDCIAVGASEVPPGSDACHDVVTAGSEVLPAPRHRGAGAQGVLLAVPGCAIPNHRAEADVPQYCDADLGVPARGEQGSAGLQCCGGDRGATMCGCSITCLSLAPTFVRSRIEAFYGPREGRPSSALSDWLTASGQTRLIRRMSRAKELA